MITSTLPLTVIINNTSGFTTTIQKAFRYSKPISQSVAAITLCGQGIGDFVRNKIYNKTNDLDTKYLPRGTYYKLHGTVILSSGLLESAKCLHDYKFINLGLLAKSVKIAGGALFIFGSMIQLERGVAILKRILTLFPKFSEMPKDMRYHLAATISGILANIGYIISTAALLIGTASSLAVLIGILSIFFDGIRNLHHYLHPFPS